MSRFGMLPTWITVFFTAVAFRSCCRNHGAHGLTAVHRTKRRSWALWPRFRNRQWPGGDGSPQPQQKLPRQTSSSSSSSVVTFSPNNNAPINDTEIHAYFLQEALREARRAGRDYNEVPIGAVVVRNLTRAHEQGHATAPISRGTTTTTNIQPPLSTLPQSFEIVGRAGNRVETTRDASAHAELLALRQAGRNVGNWRLLDCTLYSTLEPCPMCLAAVQAFRIEHLVYGAPDLRLGAVQTHLRLLDIPHPYHNVSTVVAGIHKEECGEMLRTFFRERRRAGKTNSSAATAMPDSTRTIPNNRGLSRWIRRLRLRRHAQEHNHQ